MKAIWTSNRRSRLSIIFCMICFLMNPLWQSVILEDDTQKEFSEKKDINENGISKFEKDIREYTAYLIIRTS